ncbi:cytochrome P450 [Kitasatospora nipponensis]|uniref:Cytochrome P450 n=1 Tax=Kitasatospora nipponensis TaxID=258049 RepID=A0ABP4G5K2_9ACTN
MTDPPVELGEALLGDPMTGYAELRGSGRIHRATAPDDAPVWLVTGFRDVRELAGDARLALDKRHARTRGSAGDSLPPELDAHLLNTDGVDHRRLRALVGGALGPRRIRTLRDGVRATTDRLLDAMTDGQRVDVLAELAMPLSMTVISDLLGIPDVDRLDFSAWTDTLLSPVPGAPARSRAAMREMHAFLVALITTKRAAPSDDLLGDLITAHDAGARLSEAELVAMAFLLLFGGYHNSAALVATTVMALLTHPAHRRALDAGRLTMGEVTEEVLRWNPPTMLAVRRFAVRDTRIAGSPVRAGERVWLSWAAGNRDPRAFEDPDAFNPSRATTGHLAFGHGAHYCVGAALARLENEIAVTSLLSRFPRLALACHPDELAWRPSLRSRALVALPVTL